MCDKYHQGYMTALKRQATTKIARETVLATIGVTDYDNHALGGSALFAVGYNDAIDDMTKLANEAH